MAPAARPAAVTKRDGSGTRRPMSNRTVFHVSPYVNGWKVKAEGAGDYEFEAVVDTKDSAEDLAKEKARAESPSQVIVHNQDGTIAYESTYEDDPRNVPG